MIEKAYRSRGNFSTVYKIKIHPSYDQLNYDYGDENKVRPGDRRFGGGRGGGGGMLTESRAETLVRAQATQEHRGDG